MTSKVIARAWGGFDTVSMRFNHWVVQAALVITSVFHLLPAAGLLGSQQLSRLYGLDFTEPLPLLLMRHRAVLLALVGLGLLASTRAAQAPVQELALAAAMLATGSFVALAIGLPLNAALTRVMCIDVTLFVLLAVALALRMFTPR
ncbi:phosphopantetheine adenylyltransferase [Piscinibacter terrae]|nr:phosphopantetheine adenylyltransferase [Albitalea terrae]